MIDACQAPLRLAFLHRRGTNCTTTSMMNLLHFHGLDLSEELCLGIGAGLGFTYLRGRSLDLYLVFGRSDDLELNLARAVGVQLELESDPDPRIAWAGVLDELRATGPVLLDTDVSKMPHTAETLAWPALGSHGGHKILVTGWNAGSDEAEVCDYLWPRPRWVPLSALFRAWTSASGPMMATRNFWYSATVPNRFPDVGQAIRDGVRTNLFRMTEPWNKFFGLDALKSFLLGVTGWRFALSPERRMAQAYATYVSLEVGGTGKGAFRRMYARFLREAAGVLGEPELLSIADGYFELARDWSQLAELLRQSSENPERGLFADDPAHEALTSRLLERERAGLDRLRNLAERWH